jgi:replication protein CRI
MADWPGAMVRSQGSPGAEPTERWWMTSGPVALNYYPRSGYLQVQASLPMMVYGENFSLLDRDGERYALELVDYAIDSTLRRSLPPFGTWPPARLDAVRHFHLGARDRVSAALRLLRDVEVPRWGAPKVPGPGSVSWGHRGAQQVVAYDKWREVTEAADRERRRESAQSAPTAPPPWDDVLRVESRMWRPKIIRGAMGAPGASLNDAMASGIAERPMLRVLPMIEKVLEGDVTGNEAVRTLLSKYGFARAVRLVGFAQMVKAVGIDAAEAEMSRTSLWRYMGELRDAGVEPAAIEWEAVVMPGVSRGLFKMKRAADVHLAEREAHGARRSAS